MKDGSKLFNDVKEGVYDGLYEQLMALRVAYPSYRDDQLLMKMLCDQEEARDQGRTRSKAVWDMEGSRGAPTTTLELLEEYYQVLEMFHNWQIVPRLSKFGFKTELIQLLEEAYERETVHGGLVHAGRLAKEARKKAPEGKDPGAGEQHNCEVRPVRRPEEGKLPAAGDLRAQKPGADVPELEQIIAMAHQASTFVPGSYVSTALNPFDLIEVLARHVQRLDREKVQWFDLRRELDQREL